ncbi:MAG: nickel-dependent hydrogenase large subunit [Negativicutes bacterium]|nr:nickel-dependent hydrogenase large subunit [Negativicutes bacterium]
MRKTIFPITRLHEPLQVDIQVEAGKVTDAWVGGHLFRGFEKMLKNRDPRDASMITQRICGICSTAHGVAAAYALRDAYKLAATANGELITNIILGADLMQNHLRHICLLTAFDYVKGPDQSPFAPVEPGDYRFGKQQNDKLVADMFLGADIAARAHEIAAIWGAKSPHVQTILPTGTTTPVTAERVSASASIVREIRGYVEKTLIPDIQLIADTYREYYQMGVGYGNFLSYGLFPTAKPDERALKPGRVIKLGPVLPVDTAQITESVTHAWYKDGPHTFRPLAGEAELDPEKAAGYTYVKAPRYEGMPFEGGPLARMWINGHYRRGVSAMDRIVARALELKLVCEYMLDWLARLIPGQPSLSPYTPPIAGKGSGFTDAMRGPLGHWVEINDYHIAHYEIITPTAWNFSPRDDKGLRGPVEHALIGTPVQNPDSAIEVARIVHSYDPCFSCAVHMLDLGAKKSEGTASAPFHPHQSLGNGH